MEKLIKENTPNFEIKGGRGGIFFKIKPERFFEISSIPRRVVILGKVIYGEVRTGSTIDISLPGVGEMIDCIAEIQKNKKEVFLAEVNDEIEIRLSFANIHQLKSLNDRSLVFKKLKQKL